MSSRRDFLLLKKSLYEKRVLGGKVKAPDLATVMDFLRFHPATSKGKIKGKLTYDSLNTVAE